MNPIPRTCTFLFLTVSLTAFGAIGPVSASSFALEEATIASVQAAIRRGDLTCKQLVQGYLERIEANDKKGPSLNALLMVAPDALQQAEAQDKRLASSPETAGPLHCVPVILKDNYNTADMPTTGASSSLQGMQPKKDAFSVAKLRKAGALILAKSNLQEFAMGGNYHQFPGRPDAQSLRPDTHPGRVERRYRCLDRR